MTILDELASLARGRVEKAKETVSEEELKRLAYSLPTGDLAFEKALKKPGLSFICECKKASPSKGLIAPDFPYMEIARDYEAAGADCISVLTEPFRFLGSDAYLKEIAASVNIPCLRKDFTVDEYMIYEAKVLGASAVLLICSILDAATLKKYIEICDSLGLSALVEAHDADEVTMALTAGARIIGVNNRNLKDFSVDTGNSARLRSMIPEGILFVSESGVKSAEDVRAIAESGADAVLVGEALMRAGDKKAKLDEFKSGLAKHSMSKTTIDAEAAKESSESLNFAEFGDRPAIKLCGLSRPEDIEVANKLEPEYIGFVFWDKSKRLVTPERAIALRGLLKKGIRAVGVFVDEAPEKVAELLNCGIIDIAQLHGSEDEAYIARLRALTTKPLIKAFRITDESAAADAESSSADCILLDSGKGTGVKFDWKLAEKVKRPYFLAGGLDPENVSEAVTRLHPFAVDVSSGIETGGFKDKEKAAAFVTAVRKGK